MKISAELPNMGTEKQNTTSAELDARSALEICRIVNAEDAKVAAAVERALPEVALAIDRVARALSDGGRLIYIGAGTSGRIAALDAAECPPTFNTAPSLIQAIIAGGSKALFAAAEENEDSKEAGRRDIARKRPTRKDVVVGLSASGRTPYTVAALLYARERGAGTVAVACNPDSDLARAAEISIVAQVGPEVVSGSTRMKAGTAQKMILNMISTGAMARLGFVYGNLMVNVHLKNEKLMERGIHIVRTATGLDRAAAQKAIKAAGGSIPVALVMLKTRVNSVDAERRLLTAKGNLRRAIDEVD